MNRYERERVAFLNQHGKEQRVAVVLEPGLGCHVVRIHGFDTDTLGTFTRERPRPGTQREMARFKARKGMELSGWSIGLGSEGSFAPDPYTGWLSWNRELLLWVDDRLGLEVTGWAEAPGRFMQGLIHHVHLSAHSPC